MTRKQAFFEKRTKKLLSIGSATARQKFFASFFQKRRPCLPSQRKPNATDATCRLNRPPRVTDGSPGPAERTTSGYAIRITGISVVVTLTLNAILVPRYGPMSAVAAGTGCEAVLMGLVYVALARHVPGALAWEMLPFIAASCLIWFGTNVIVRVPWLGVLMVAAWAAAGYSRERTRPERCA